MLWGIFLAAIALVFVMIRVFARDVTEVRVAPVTRQNLVRSVSTNGKVEPIQEYQAHAPAPGVVGKVYVEVGQKVKPGELLITMNDSDATARLAAANASLSSAQAAVHDMEQGGSQDERLTLDADLSRAKLQQGQASTNLTAIEDLEKKGAASASEVAAAQERLRSANSTLDSLQLRSTGRYSADDKARITAQLNDAKAAVAAAQNGYAAANIRSPLAGTVYSIPVSAYDFVPAGKICWISPI